MKRWLPTLHELREVCHAQATPKGKAYVGGIPLDQHVQAVQGEGGGPASPDQAAALVDEVAARAQGARMKLLPGPGNTGHRGLARIPLRAVPSSRLTDEEWEARRRRLLEQAGS